MLGLLRARQSFGHVQAVALASMIEISSAGWQSSGRKECRKKMWNKTVDSTERERKKKRLYSRSLGEHSTAAGVCVCVCV